jgi:hypothetical protein
VLGFYISGSMKSDLHNHRCENLKSYKFCRVYWTVQLDAEKAHDLQMQPTEMQCDSILKLKSSAVSVSDFHFD